MNQSGAKTERPSPRLDAGGGKGRARLTLGVLVAVPFTVASLALAFVTLTHTPVPVPQWIVEQVEDRANAALDDRLRIAVVGGAQVVFGPRFAPQIELRMVRIMQPSGLPIAILPRISTTFQLQPLFHGQIELRAVEIDRPTIALRRLPDGRLDLNLGTDAAVPDLEFRDIAQVTGALKQVLSIPLLSSLDDISAQDVRLRLDDMRLGQVWQVSGGRFDLRQTPDHITAGLTMAVGARGDAPAQISLSGSVARNGPQTDLSASFTRVPARDLAMQSPAMSMLGVLDAPISGSLRSGIDAQGALQRVDAALDVGPGWISPTGAARPIGFAKATVRLNYIPDQHKVTLEEARVLSRALRFNANGQVYLKDFRAGFPQSGVGQIRMSQIQADPDGVFEQPAKFDLGVIDFRLHSEPFRVEIGQLFLQDPQTRISGKGTIFAEPQGWQVDFDSSIDQIDRQKLIALWPPAVVPETRAWVADNIATAVLHNVRSAIRMAPDQPPRFELSYAFSDTEATLLRTLPPVQEGRGFATMFGNNYSMKVEHGNITAPQGGIVDVSGSDIVVPNIAAHPPQLDLRLMTSSTIPAVLSILDQPPFQFLKKAGRAPDIATGWARVRTDVSLPLEKDLPIESVAFNVRGQLLDVRSDKVVPGRVVRADRMAVNVDPHMLSIGGRGWLNGIAFDGTWSQSLDKGNNGRSSVKGHAQITNEGLQSVGVNLPPGLISGSGWGIIDLELAGHGQDRFDFLTDLRGVGMAIPQIGWQKPPAASGKLAVSGQLSNPPQIDNLSINASGLSADGKVALSRHGLQRATLSRLRVGDWLNVRADLVGAGPDVVLRGGSLDIRKLPDMGGGSGGEPAASKAATSTRVSGHLNRVQVADGIALTQMNGDFNTFGGISGVFAGRVNDGAVVNGEVGPAADGRPAVRLTAQNAGAVLESIGATDRVSGGQMVLNLSPLGRHTYDGAFDIKDVRVKNVPLAASFVSAISGVGLVDQLRGEGIVFGDVSGAFRLTPEGVSITRAAAQGAALAVTVAGNFFPKTGQLDLEGVVSPFYFLNAIGQLVSRSGEGLFGMTYTLRGTVQHPDVSVNPASILAPGALRDLFRKAPPVLPIE